MNINDVCLWFNQNRMARIAALALLWLFLIVVAWVVTLLLLYGLWVVLDSTGEALDWLHRMAWGASKKAT